MSEKLGWYEIHSTKDGVSFFIFSKHGQMDNPNISIEFLETDFEEGKWFASSMEINNPAIEEFSEIAIKILNFLRDDPTTINEMINILDAFLSNKEIKKAPLE